MPTGARRIGIQVGHWMTDQVPAELGTRITFQTGTSWAGVQEVDVNMDIAQRIKAQLTARGYIVDIIPTTVPVGYLADVFLDHQRPSTGNPERRRGDDHIYRHLHLCAHPVRVLPRPVLGDDGHAHAGGQPAGRVQHDAGAREELGPAQAAVPVMTTSEVDA